MLPRRLSFTWSRALAYRAARRGDKLRVRGLCAATDNVVAPQPSAGTREVRTEPTFPELFKNSKFASILNPVGKKVDGVVLAVVNGNLYVDFGCKFHAVVPVPKMNASEYRKNTKVVVRVLDVEMTNHFIGDSSDLSLLEAEAELIGLA